VAKSDVQEKLVAKQQAAQKAAAAEPPATVETRLTALEQTVQKQLVRVCKVAQRWPGMFVLRRSR